MDDYLYQAFWRVEGAGFPITDYPRFADHPELEAKVEIRIVMATTTDDFRKIAQVAASRFQPTP